MSQNKRNNEMKTAHKKLMIENTIIVAVVICVFGFFGYSVLNKSASEHVETHYINTNVVSDYMNSVDGGNSKDSTESDKSGDSSDSTETTTETQEGANNE